jgi:hypothetical protein
MYHQSGCEVSRMKNLKGRKLVVCIGLMVLVFALMSQASGQQLIFKTDQVRGHSSGGSGTADFMVAGFTPGTTAYVSLIGWSFKLESETPRPIHEIGIWTQEAIPGGWRWTNEFKVNPNGQIQGRFNAFINDDNDDDPFGFLVNYLVIGQ